MKKLIICDIDGVLLNHNQGFLEHVHCCGRISEEKFQEIQAAYDKKPFGGFKSFTEITDTDTAKILQEEISRFNRTTKFGALRPYDGVMEINKFRDDADFVYVSSCGVSMTTQENRMNNIQRFFPYLFKEAHHLPALASKVYHLEQLKKRGQETLYLEDSVGHVKDGIRLRFENVMACHGRKESETPVELEVDGVWCPLTVAHAGYELVYFVEKFIKRS